MDALTFAFTALESGQSVQVAIQKPIPHDTMECWVCHVCIRPDDAHVREFFGATSFQALEAAVSITPTLLSALFPGQTFEEAGFPFFATSLLVDADPADGR